MTSDSRNQRMRRLTVISKDCQRAANGCQNFVSLARLIAVNWEWCWPPNRLNLNYQWVKGGANLLKTLQLENVVFTMMRCTVKKTTQLIIEGGSLLWPLRPIKLLAQLGDKNPNTQPEDRFVDIEKMRGRITCRPGNGSFRRPYGVDIDWLATEACSSALGRSAGKAHQQTNYYISSFSHFGSPPGSSA